MTMDENGEEEGWEGLWGAVMRSTSWWSTPTTAINNNTDLTSLCQRARSCGDAARLVANRRSYEKENPQEKRVIRHIEIQYVLLLLLQLLVAILC